MKNQDYVTRQFGYISLPYFYLPITETAKTKTKAKLRRFLHEVAFFLLPDISRFKLYNFENGQIMGK